MGMIREVQESDLEEVFNLIYSAFGDRAESDSVRQLIKVAITKTKELDIDVFLSNRI